MGASLRPRDRWAPELSDLEHSESVSPLRLRYQAHHVAIIAMREVGAVAEGHAAQVDKAHGPQSQAGQKTLLHEAWSVVAGD
jgi:hypothetical protein